MCFSTFPESAEKVCQMNKPMVSFWISYIRFGVIMFLLRVWSVQSVYGQCQIDSTFLTEVQDIQLDRFDLDSGKENELILPFSYGQVNFIDSSQHQGIELDDIISVRLLYTRHKTSPDFSQQDLNKSRLCQLESFISGIFEADNINWEFVEQTGCNSAKSCDSVFHGFIIEYKEEPIQVIDMVDSISREGRGSVDTIEAEVTKTESQNDQIKIAKRGYKGSRYKYCTEAPAHKKYDLLVTNVREYYQPLKSMVLFDYKLFYCASYDHFSNTLEIMVENFENAMPVYINNGESLRKKELSPLLSHFLHLLPKMDDLSALKRVVEDNPEKTHVMLFLDNRTRLANAELITQIPEDIKIDIFLLNVYEYDKVNEVYKNWVAGHTNVTCYIDTKL